MTCQTCHRNQVEPGTTECFRCRVSSVGFSFKGGAITGRHGWNTSRDEFMTKHFGTTDDRELGKRGIERASQ